MKAIRIHSYGTPDVLKLEEIPKPSISDDEVLIKVHATGINPMDYKIRQGDMESRFHLPIILGCDIAGIVEAVGSAVTNFNPGDRVYTMQEIVRGGGYAEYVAVRAINVAAQPNSLDFVSAAAVPLSALTAWQALFEQANLSSGQKVLIHAAAGGVGSYAVQLAKAKGLHVIGTASAANTDFVHKLGASEVIDYKTTNFEDVVHDVDAVLDLIGGDTQERSWQTLKKGGVLIEFVPTSPPSDETAAKYGVRAVMFGVKPNAEQLTQIAELIDAGKVKAMVETVLPLAQAKEAHQMSESGHTRGKIVLKIVT